MSDILSYRVTFHDESYCRIDVAYNSEKNLWVYQSLESFSPLEVVKILLHYRGQSPKKISLWTDEDDPDLD